MGSGSAWAVGASHTSPVSDVAISADGDKALPWPMPADTLGSMDRERKCCEAKFYVFSAIHVVVKRSISGMPSAKPAPMDFSSLPPTKGILTFT